MRKIEQQMIAAIKAGNEFMQDNTCVEQVPITGQVSIMTCDTVAQIYLHANHIASVYPDQSIEVNTNTLKQYPTRTTMSRLRALGVDVCTKKGKILLDGQILA